MNASLSASAPERDSPSPVPVPARAVGDVRTPLRPRSVRGLRPPPDGPPPAARLLPRCRIIRRRVTRASETAATVARLTPRAPPLRQRVAELDAWSGSSSAASGRRRSAAAASCGRRRLRSCHRAVVPPATTAGDSPVGGPLCPLRPPRRLPSGVPAVSRTAAWGALSSGPGRGRWAGRTRGRNALSALGWAMLDRGFTTVRDTGCADWGIPRGRPSRLALMPRDGLRIGIVGGFDVENYGDLLFPLIAEAELARRLGALALHRFSYHQKMPPDWPYSVTSVSDFPGAVRDLDSLLVGGGHLIRFDKDVAPGYGPPTAEIHHPTGFWLTPILIALQHGLPAYGTLPGVYGDIPVWAEPLMRLVLALSRYVAVRDEESLQALLPFAGPTEIAVVPDTAFGISRLLERERPSSGFTALRTSMGLSRPYIVVQATAAVQDFQRFVHEHQQLLRDHSMVVLPVGPILGDRDSKTDCNLAGVVRLPAWPGPTLLAELIGHASAAVGVSLHLAITALAFGVPVFRPAHAFAESTRS